MLIVLVYNYLYSLYLYNHIIIYFIIFFGVFFNVKFNRRVLLYPFAAFIFFFWAVLATIKINYVVLNKIQTMFYLMCLL